MRFQSALRTLPLAAALVALGGCILNVEDIAGMPGRCDEVAITSYQTEIAVRDSIWLSARKARSDGSSCLEDENEGIHWRSGSPQVASVHDGVWLVGVTAGWATVTAENIESGKSRSMSVRVVW